ncbi:MAG: ATP synthase F1 subunit epsilon [Phycisphaerae bacterium]
MSDKTFHTSVVTPERIVLETPTTFAVVPASDGQLGILTHHASLTTKLATGTLKLETPDGVHQFIITGGYAQMKDNALTVLTEEAIPEQTVTSEFLQAEQAKAEALPAGDMAQAEKRQQALARMDAMRKLMNQRQ